MRVQLKEKAISVMQCISASIYHELFIYGEGKGVGGGGREMVEKLAETAVFSSSLPLYIHLSENCHTTFYATTYGDKVLQETARKSNLKAFNPTVKLFLLIKAQCQEILVKPKPILCSM